MTVSPAKAGSDTIPQIPAVLGMTQPSRRGHFQGAQTGRGPSKLIFEVLDDASP